MKQNEIFHCLDEDEYQELELFGEDDNGEYQALHLVLQPCKENLAAGICVNRTLEEIQDYLKQPNLMLYTNTERFDSREYHEGALVRESKVISQQLSLKEPIFIDSHIKMNELDDEIDYFQLG